MSGINRNDECPCGSMKKYKKCCLNKVPWEDLLRENNFDKIRKLFREIWRKSSIGESNDKQQALALADELSSKVDEADEEWKKIDRELLKIIGLSGGASIAAMAERIATSPGQWVWPALALAGTAIPSLAFSYTQRKTFKNRFPAGFFLKYNK